MKRFTQICLILMVICTILGLGFFLGGIALGGSPEELFEEVDHEDLHFGSEDLPVDDPEEIAERAMPDFLAEQISETGDGETIDCSDIREISADMRYGGLFLEPWDGDHIRVSVSGDEGKLSEVKENNGKLKIQNHFKRFCNSNVTLYCPANLELGEVEIKMRAGEVGLYAPLTAEKLEVEIGAGTFANTAPLCAKKSDWTVGMGEIVLDQFSGEKMELECGMGSLEAYIDGSESDYSYDLECAAGDLQVGGKSYGGLGENEIRNDGADGKMIEASCAMGAVTINFIGDGAHHSEDHAHEEEGYHE